MNATSTATAMQNTAPSQFDYLVAETTTFQMHELQFVGNNNGTDNLG